MPMFTVTIDRTERIAFEVEADNAEQAEEDYLAAGDITFSRTLDTQVVGITQHD